MSHEEVKTIFGGEIPVRISIGAGCDIEWYDDFDVLVFYDSNERMWSYSPAPSTY